MSTVELLLSAVDTIRASKARAFLTTLGVIIGVLAIILLVALGDGARQYLANEFSQIGSNLLQVMPGRRETKGFGPGPPTVGVRNKLTREDELALARRATTLDGVSGIVNGSGTIRYLNRRRDTFVFGVSHRFSEIRNLKIDQGRFFDEEDIDARRRYVVLGRVLQNELFGDENPLGKMVKVADAEFRVIGLFEHKGTSLGFDLDDLVVIPETAALDLYGLEGYNNIMARARARADMTEAVAEITDLLSRRHADQTDFTVVSQDDLIGTFNAIMGTMTLVLLAIASIALVVGGIGIANIMLVAVRERTREIGVRRAVGATRLSILLQFLVESVVIALLGGLIGLGIGSLIIAVARLAAPTLPVQLSGWIVGVAIGFSAVVGVVSGVVPARRAAALDPVEALRYE
jgi:putative ABC transport system permease protein